MTILANKSIPFEVIETERVFVLLEIRPTYEHDSTGKRTDTIVGHSYSVANIESFEKYKIKVLHTKPLLSNEDLQAKREAGEKVFVEFENASLKMYFSSFTHAYEDSITADDVTFVETE